MNKLYINIISNVFSPLLSCFIFIVVANAHILQAQSVEFELAYTGFSSSVDIASTGGDDDRLFIVERNGIIRIIENGVTLPTPFLDIDVRVTSGGERGLLGLAFHPDYDSNGYFFVNYYNNNNETVIARYSVSATDPNIADFDSEAIVMTYAQPFTNHNGGDLNFSPNDGYLYIGTGDGGSGGDPSCYAQNPLSRLGKMLRIDVDGSTVETPNYSIPADNPYVGDASYLPEIWSTGLRNPWRYSFHPETGDLWIADVGQSVKEEVNVVSGTSSGGENYGWKVMEGTHCYDPDPIDTDCPAGVPSCDDPIYTDPVFEYDHNSSGGYSITGGYVFTGCRYPDLADFYICSDYVLPNTWIIDSDVGNASTPISGGPSNISTYGVGNNGQIYLATLSGSIYRVNDGSIPRVLTLTIEDSPLSGDYEALDSIIVEDNVSVAANNIVTLSSATVRIADMVNVPSTSEILVEATDCE